MLRVALYFMVEQVLYATYWLGETKFGYCFFEMVMSWRTEGRIGDKNTLCVYADYESIFHDLVLGREGGCICIWAVIISPDREV